MKKYCSNAGVKSFAFTLVFGSHLILSCPEMNFKLYHIIWFIINKDVRKIWFLPRETSVETFSWTPPKLGYSIGFGSPSSWMKGQKVRNLLTVFDIILFGSTYPLFLFFVSFQLILKCETAFPLKFSIFTYLQVRQFCYPNMASLPTAYSICAGILFCNMSQSKMSIQSKAMLLFLVERWAFDWSGDLTLICGPIWQ